MVLCFRIVLSSCRFRLSVWLKGNVTPPITIENWITAFSLRWTVYDRRIFDATQITAEFKHSRTDDNWKPILLEANLIGSQS